MEKPTPDDVNRELEASRLAIVSLLAVITDEQLGSVETALEALEPMYGRARAALEEIRAASRNRRITGGQVRDAIEAHLATPGEARLRSPRPMRDRQGTCGEQV